MWVKCWISWLNFKQGCIINIHQSDEAIQQWKIKSLLNAEPIMYGITEKFQSFGFCLDCKFFQYPAALWAPIHRWQIDFDADAKAQREKKGLNERSCYRILFVTLKVAWSSMAQPAKWITNETWVPWSDSDQKRTGKMLSPISKSAFAFYVIFGQPSLSKLSPSLCHDIYMRSGKLMSIKNLISRTLYPMLLYSVNVWQSVV